MIIMIIMIIIIDNDYHFLPLWHNKHGEPGPFNAPSLKVVVETRRSRMGQDYKTTRNENSSIDSETISVSFPLSPSLPLLLVATVVVTESVFAGSDAHSP